MSDGIFPLIELAIQVCADRGVRDFVVAPGSRSAPITAALARRQDFALRVVYDERAAGYIALGMAQQLRRPVGLVCTSGTAAVNFGPAVVEAFYQQIPLLVLTADRPPEWIDQQDNQAIHQQGLYAAHIRYQATLPVGDGHADTRWHAQRVMVEALDAAQGLTPGPVHVNVPLREPLYAPPTYRPEAPAAGKTAVRMPARPALDEPAWDALRSQWHQARRKLIVAGMLPADPALDEPLRALQDDPSVALFADITANLWPDVAPLVHADVALGTQDGATLDRLSPDLVVYLGGQVTSKYLKQLLRKRPPQALWRIQPEGPAPDPYQATTTTIPLLPADFLQGLVQNQGTSPTRRTANPSSGLACGVPETFPVETLAAHVSSLPDSDYAQCWARLGDQARRALLELLEREPFGEFRAVQQVLHSLPAGSLLQVGNSMPIRYANFAGIAPGHVPTQINANRGTSGIDGTVSTAVGAALASGRLTTLLVGDLAFFYDRNGLWHNHLPANLRIVLFNNHGGGIFDIIDGPNRLDAPTRSTYFLTPQPLTAQGTARDHGLAYTHVRNEAELQDALTRFFDPARGAALLEVESDMATNRAIFQAFRSMAAELHL